MISFNLGVALHFLCIFLFYFYVKFFIIIITKIKERQGDIVVLFLYIQRREKKAIEKKIIRVKTEEN